MKILLQAALLASLTGCVPASPWGENCPAPKTDANGALLIEDGQTLKCQIRVSTSNMGCTDDITNDAGDDGYACTGAANQGAVFFFDKNGVLKSHEFIQADKP
jgi:lipoprotein